MNLDFNMISTTYDAKHIAQDHSLDPSFQNSASHSVGKRGKMDGSKAGHLWIHSSHSVFHSSIFLTPWKLQTKQVKRQMFGEKM